MNIKIAKYEDYPTLDPTGRAVGFRVTCTNGRSFYRDTIVPFSGNEAKTDDEMINIAWGILETEITSHAEYLETLHSLVGSDWNAPTAEPVAEEPAMVEEPAPEEGV